MNAKTKKAVSSGGVVARVHHGKVEIFLFGCAVLILIALMLRSPGQRESEWQQATGGDLAIAWKGGSWNEIFDLKAFYVTFYSFESRPLTGCGMAFDNESFGMDSLRFNTPQTPEIADHYSEKISTIQPNIPFEIGYNSDTSGVRLKSVPKVVRLECAEGFSEWKTGF